MDHLIVLNETIKEIKAMKKTAYIIFLDVEKAYDKAWLNGILYVLNKSGVEGKKTQNNQEPEPKSNSQNPNKPWTN